MPLDLFQPSQQIQTFGEFSPLVDLLSEFLYLFMLFAPFQRFLSPLQISPHSFCFVFQLSLLFLYFLPPLHLLKLFT
jgi:hypothetical protein